MIRRAAVVVCLLALLGSFASPASAGSVPPPVREVRSWSDTADNNIRTLWRAVPYVTGYQVRYYEVLDDDDRVRGSFVNRGLRLVERRRVSVPHVAGRTVYSSGNQDGFAYQATYLVQVLPYNASGFGGAGYDVASTGTRSTYLRCALTATALHVTRAWANTVLTVLSQVPGPVGRAAGVGSDVIGAVEVATDPTNTAQGAMYVVSVTLKRENNRKVNALLDVWQAAQVAKANREISKKVDDTCGAA